jgi:hypothetical protein
MSMTGKNKEKNADFPGCKGSALLIVMLVLTSILTIAIGFSTLIIQGIIMNRNQENSTVAYFASEAGAERVLFSAFKAVLPADRLDLTASECVSGRFIDFSASPPACRDTDDPEMDDAETWTNLPNQARYAVRYSLDGTTVRLKSIGEYRGVRRSVEVSF